MLVSRSLPCPRVMCRARPVMMWLPCTRRLRLEQLPGLSPTRKQRMFPKSSLESASPFPSRARSTSRHQVQWGAASGCPASGRRCSCQPPRPHRNANPNSLRPNQANYMFSLYWTTRDALVSPAARSGALEKWRGECLTSVQFRRGASPAWEEDEVGDSRGAMAERLAGLGAALGGGATSRARRPPCHYTFHCIFYLSAQIKIRLYSTLTVIHGLIPYYQPEWMAYERCFLSLAAEVWLLLWVDKCQRHVRSHTPSRSPW